MNARERAAAAVAWSALAAMLGCGGRAVIDPPSASGVGGSDGGFAPHPPCGSDDGIRLCGGVNDCPWLVPPECPGFGCTPALDRATAEPSDTGVCWADMPTAGAEPCAMCPDGDVCVQKTPDQLVCAPQGLCAALWDLGATGVCRYADKAGYDHLPLPVPTGPCPDADVFCGGACGDCYAGGLRCTGRSPLHPFGICVAVGMSPAHACALVPGGPVMVPCEPDEHCAVFDVPPADVAAAAAYGICRAPTSCAYLAIALPGGMRCFDGDGNEVPP